MSADSEKPYIIGGNWMKYCTMAKSMGGGSDLKVRRRPRARRLRSAAGSINAIHVQRARASRNVKI